MVFYPSTLGHFVWKTPKSQFLLQGTVANFIARLTLLHIYLTLLHIIACQLYCTSLHVNFIAYYCTSNIIARHYTSTYSGAQNKRDGLQKVDGFCQILPKPLVLHISLVPHFKALICGYLEPKKLRARPPNRASMPLKLKTIQFHFKGPVGSVWRHSPLSLELHRTEYQGFKIRYIKVF